MYVALCAEWDTQSKKPCYAIKMQTSAGEGEYLARGFDYSEFEKVFALAKNFAKNLKVDFPQLDYLQKG